MSEAPLTLEQMNNVVERRGGDIPRVPLFWHKFYNTGTVEKYGEALDALNRSIVDDCVNLHYVAPSNFEAPQGAPGDYKWAIEPRPDDWEARGITSRLVVSSTELIDDFVTAMPDPSPTAYYQGAGQVALAHPGRYCVGWDPFFLFERAWFLFGMENILCEMALNPDRMGRLLRALCDYHKKVMTGLAGAGAHCYFTTDDLGTQSSLMFSRELFRSMYLPLYEELIDHCHDLGMHFWLHCCGAVTELLDDFVAVELDVLHPIQPGAMDQQAVARAYRGKLTFLAGIDVQRLLPCGGVRDVIDGTKALIDTFDHEEGGCILAASNGIMPETPLENIEAWLRTAESYGKEKRMQYCRSS
ncbi:MAG: uroporphyrinogen decarboxylase family protein [Planctomycetota bacterium]